MKDLFGQAIFDFYTKQDPENIWTETNISEQEEMEVSYLFREFEQMPILEKTALNLANGKILDIGCGAGSHSLYLQNQQKDVTAIDISKKAIETCKLRGIKKAQVIDVLDFPENEKFDTILLLMNGTGIFGNIEKTTLYFEKLKKILSTNGSVLLDSSDLIYMYPKKEQKFFRNNANHEPYYGQLTFEITYKNQTEDSFEWLYLDFEKLKEIASKNGFDCNLVQKGEHFDYLAKLSQKP